MPTSARALRPVGHRDDDKVDALLDTSTAVALIVADHTAHAITIEATLAGDNQLSLCVADRGPGVPEGDIERVFEAFYSTKISGLGIGLSLCRKLIEAHGGSLVAKRRSGGGAAFEFTLPLTDEGEGDPSP